MDINLIIYIKKTTTTTTAQVSSILI